MLGNATGARIRGKRASSPLPSVPHSPETQLALGATIYNFDIELADVDRRVYETFALRAAWHPSESPEYLATRVLAYCLEYTEGIAFGRGISEPDDPPLAVRDLTGTIKSWIEIGAPDAARLHKASKAAPRVAVYTHKDTRVWLRQLEAERIHRKKALEIYSFDPGFIGALVEMLERRTAMTVSISDRQLYVTIGGATAEGEVVRHTFEA